MNQFSSTIQTAHLPHNYMSLEIANTKLSFATLLLLLKLQLIKF